MGTRFCTFGRGVPGAQWADGVAAAALRAGIRKGSDNQCICHPTGKRLDLAWLPIEAARLSQKSITLSRPVIFHFSMDAERRREMSERVFGALANGTLQPRIARYTLSAAAEAHRDLESRRTTGQVILLA